MKRAIKIICGIVLTLVILLGGLAVWQWDNIEAGLRFLQFSKEELEQQITDNDQTIRDAMSKAEDVVVRELTEEEKQALRDGTVSKEELAEQLVQVEKPAPKPESAPESKPDDQKSEQEKAEEERKRLEEEKKLAYQQRLSELIAEVYVLREEYLIALDNMRAEAIADYKAIPGSGRTKTAITNLVSDYLARATNLEKECDKKMDAIVSEMTKLIKDNDGDMSTVDTVIRTYAEEKKLKKAWYMAELQEKGFV